MFTRILRMLTTVWLVAVYLLAEHMPSLAQTPTPAPTYRIAFVAPDDPLNVREGPGVNRRLLGSLPLGTRGIRIVGEGVAVNERSMWVPIEVIWNESLLRGWVNRYYLVEDVPIIRFCADEGIFPLIDQLKEAVLTQDGEALTGISFPIRGLLLRRHWWNTEVRFLPLELPDFFRDRTQRDWGTADGSGFPIKGSAAQIVLPLLQRDLLNAEQINCGFLENAPSAGLIKLPPEYEPLNVYSLFRPAPKDNEFDWGMWVIGIDYWDSTPKVSFMVHYQWEI